MYYDQSLVALKAKDFRLPKLDLRNVYEKFSILHDPRR